MLPRKRERCSEPAADKIMPKQPCGFIIPRLVWAAFLAYYTARPPGVPPDLAPGEVAEWLNAPHSKCGIGASLSGVRIPPSPPVAANLAMLIDH